MNGAGKPLTDARRIDVIDFGILLFVGNLSRGPPFGQ